MRAQVYNRDRFEVEGYTANMGWVVVSHPEELDKAKSIYDELAFMIGKPGGYEKLRIRHRHIRESVQFVAPDAFEVITAWREGFEFLPTTSRFFSEERALAFAKDGNDPKIAATVHCVNVTTGRTIYRWPEQGA